MSERKAIVIRTRDLSSKRTRLLALLEDLELPAAARRVIGNGFEDAARREIEQLELGITRVEAELADLQGAPLCAS